MKKFSVRHLILVAIILLSLVGGLVAIYSTVKGPWGYTDPVEYISVARSLDRGQGLGYYEGSARFTQEKIHPPLYSLVLSAIGLFGVDLVVASRWLNIFAFVASIFLAGWIFYRYSRAPAIGILASALMCAFPWMVVMFSSSYSEPLFVLSILSGGLGLLAYLKNEKTSLLVASAIIVGTIPGTRYAGIGMVASAGLTVFLFASGKFWPRVRKAVVFTLIAGLPVLLWLVWVYFSSAHSVGGRSLGVDLGDLSAKFQTFRGVFMDTVWKWVPFQAHGSLLPYKVRWMLMLAILAVVTGLCLWAQRCLKKEIAENGPLFDIRVFTFFGLSSLIFVIVLIATYLFTSPTIDIDNRMLLPLYASSVMFFLAALALWQAAWFKGRLRLLQVLPVLIAALFIYWYIPQTIDKVDFYHKGDGLTLYRWKQAEIIQAVRALPADQPVIANDWELTMLWTGRPIHGLWTSFPPGPSFQSGAYGTNLNDPLQVLFCEKGAALVIYNDFPSQFDTTVGHDNFEKLPVLFTGLSLYGTYPDGKIYLCH